MAEHLKLFVAPTNSEDIQAEADISSITLTNFDAVPGSTGTFARKPTIVVRLSSSDAEPTGWCFSFDFGLNNRVKSATITTVGNTGTESYSYTPQAPYISDTISVGCVTTITCVINSALIPGIPLKFGGFHFGQNSVDISSGVKSCKIIQSADLSGQTCPFSTLTATFQGNGISSFFPYGQKITCKTDVKAIGNFYVTECTTTRRALNYDGVNQFSLSAMSMMGVLAEAGAYLGWTNPWSSPGMNINTVFNNIVNGLYTTDLSMFNEGAPSYRSGFCWATILEENDDRRAVLAKVALGAGLWLDPDGAFRSIDTSSTPIVIPRSRIYDGPTITSRDQVSKLEFIAYRGVEGANQQITRYLRDGTEVTDYGKQFNAKSTTLYSYYDTDDIFTRTVSGKSIALTIDSPSLPCYYRNSPLQDYIYDKQKAYWSRSDIWTGKILWNTATAEGRLGTRVTVYDQAGQTFTGNVISSNLNFSGASVTAEIQVLKDGTWS